MSPASTIENFPALELTLLTPRPLAGRFSGVYYLRIGDARFLTEAVSHALPYITLRETSLEYPGITYLLLHSGDSTEVLPIKRGNSER